MNNLESFKLLGNNWNTYNAGQFDAGHIDKVVNIVSKLSHSPLVFPTGRNSIQLEFDKGSNYLEFEIYPDKIMWLMIIGGKEQEQEITESEIKGIVEGFYK